MKGPIYLVCISCTEESYERLRGQLELMYGQVLLLLHSSLNTIISFYSDYISAYMPSPSLYWLLSGNMILQLLLILTKSVNRCFEKNPKFDMAPLLGGTDAVFLSLIHAFSWSVQFFLCLGFILCWINVWKHSLGIPSNGWTGIQRRFFMHTHASLSRNQQGRQLAQFCRMLLIQGFYLHCWCVSTRFVQLHARTCTVILTT